MDFHAIDKEIEVRKFALKLVLDIPSDDPAGAMHAIEENTKTKKFLDRIKKQVKQIKDEDERNILDVLVEGLAFQRRRMLNKFLGVAL